MTEQLKHTIYHPAIYPVPRGSKSSVCRSSACNARIYWVELRVGIRTPVDCAVEGGREPTDDSDGQGWSHFVTCPARDSFSKKRRT